LSIRSSIFVNLAVAGTLMAHAAHAQTARSQRPLTVDVKLAARGKALFTAKGCTACHNIGAGRTVGPDLAGLFQRRTVPWVKAWLRDPDKMLEKDDTAKAMFDEYNIAMPNLNLTDAEITALMHYIAQQNKPPAPKEK
jgi:nitrite reductase (NO-forming)